MKTTLSVLERITLLGLLPKEGTILTLRVLRDLQRETSFSEAELTALESRIVQQAPASLGLLTSSVPVALDLKNNFTWLAARNLRSGL